MVGSDKSMPFVEVRTVDGVSACAVIEFVPADVPDDERHAVILKMRERLAGADLRLL